MAEKTQGGRVGAVRVMQRALRQRCPNCGRGRVFDGWYELREWCAECDYAFEAKVGDHWGVFYVTTAAVPGLLILVVVFLPPPATLAGRLLWFGFFCGLMIATMQVRRSIGVALDFLARRAWPNPEPGRADFNDEDGA